MSTSQAVAQHLPYLRRYARALTGSQHTGDAFVRATLEAALADEQLKSSLAGGRVPLGLLTVKQALNLPHLSEFRFCQTQAGDRQDRCLSREELEELVKQ